MSGSEVGELPGWLLVPAYDPRPSCVTDSRHVSSLLLPTILNDHDFVTITAYALVMFSKCSRSLLFMLCDLSPNLHASQARISTKTFSERQMLILERDQS